MRSYFVFSHQEEKRAQHMKYQRNLPRQGQAPMGGMGNSAVGQLGAMMAQQQGMPPQQPGMRHPMPPHGEYILSVTPLWGVFAVGARSAGAPPYTFRQVILEPADWLHHMEWEGL